MSRSRWSARRWRGLPARRTSRPFCAGYHASAPTPDFTAKLWNVRLALELVAGETILRRYPDAGARRVALASLRRLHERLAGAAARPHHSNVTLNARFHDMLFEIAGHNLLTDSCHCIRMRLFAGWIQQRSQAWRTRLETEQKEHEAILDALPPETVRRSTHPSVATWRSLADALADLEARTTARQKQTEDHDAEIRL